MHFLLDIVVVLCHSVINIRDGASESRTPGPENRRASHRKDGSTLGIEGRAEGQGEPTPHMVGDRFEGNAPLTCS